MATEMQIETKTEKTMTEGVVEKTLHFEASRERVWKAITDPAELTMWFGDGPATRVEWNLTEHEGGGTTLHLRESGFLTDLHHQQNDGGWDEELGELVTLLES